MAKPRRGMAIILDEENRMLLVRDSGKRSYSLPGGHPNQNEHHLCTAVREVYEELGIDARTATRLYDCDCESRHYARIAR